VYEAHGEFQAPYYFRVNNLTGGIYVRNDLKEDLETRYLVSSKYNTHLKNSKL